MNVLVYWKQKLKP